MPLTRDKTDPPHQKGPVFTTATGKSIREGDISSRDIDGVTIGQGLSKICRFGGQIQGFYSVARHSLNLRHVLREILPRHMWIYPLLHDAAEAYIQDIPVPFKAGLSDYKKLEGRFMAAICGAFQLQASFFPGVIKEFDTRLALNEAALFSQKPLWAIESSEQHLQTFGRRVMAVSSMLLPVPFRPRHDEDHIGVDYTEFMAALADDLEVADQFRRGFVWEQRQEGGQ